MMYQPLYNTMQGIQLAQIGRKNEALAYLREAVQQEPINEEVWLWLAHVTPDVHEYQNCVYQALLLSPNHNVARQMQDALMQAQMSVQMAPPPPTMQAPPQMQPQFNTAVLMQARQKQRRRWWLKRIAILGIVGSILGIVAAGLVLLVLESPFF